MEPARWDQGFPVYPRYLTPILTGVRGLEKRERTWDEEDRIIDRDDEFSLSYTEEPRFKSVNELYEARQLAKEMAVEEQAEREKQEVENYEREYAAAVQKVGTWDSDSASPEGAAVACYRERMQKFQQGAAEWEGRKQQVVQQITALNQAGRAQEAQQLAQQFLGIKDELQKEHDELVQLTHQGQRRIARKQLQAGQLELLKLAPGLRDADTRERFIRFLGREHGVPRRHAEAETNPQIVARYYREFEKTERATYERLARKRIKDTVPRHTRGVGTADNSKDARKEMAVHTARARQGMKL